jgi:hypothetical protein
MASKNGAKFDLDGYNRDIDQFLGVTVWWTVHRLELPYQQLQQALADAGLDKELLEQVSNKVAFKRTADSIKNSDDKRFVRKITDNKEKAVVGVVKENIDQNTESLSYTQETTAHLNKESGQVAVEGPDAAGFAERYEKYQKVLTDYDVRGLIRDLVDTLKGVALRQSGGIYFIPKHMVQTLVQLDTFLRSQNIGKMYIMHMLDTSVEREIAWDAMEEEMDAKIAGILEAVENIQERAACLDKQDAKLNAAKKVMEEYVKFTDCEAQAESIREKFEAAEQKIAEKIAAMAEK